GPTAPRPGPPPTPRRRPASRRADRRAAQPGALPVRPAALLAAAVPPAALRRRAVLPAAPAGRAHPRRADLGWCGALERAGCRVRRDGVPRPTPDLPDQG